MSTNIGLILGESILNFYSYFIAKGFLLLNCLPSLNVLSFREVSDYPISYKINSKKELYMLSCCENFQRQYSHLYRDRKPLFFAPKNECGVEVCILKIS